MVAGRPYPGTCRSRNNDVLTPAPTEPPSSLRLKIPPDLDQIEFNDELLGRTQQQLTQQSGDFIVRRADGLISYQLAVVIDDAITGVTRVVRGADLLESTPRQILLQNLLQLPQPAYLHLPVLLNRSGTKLSKQAHAQPLDSSRAGQNLHLLLQLLNQSPPSALQRETPTQILAWATEHWRCAAVPRTTELTGYIAH